LESFSLADESKQVDYLVGVNPYHVKKSKEFKEF
jgi:hypothetical protein